MESQPSTSLHDYRFQLKAEHTYWLSWLLPELVVQDVTDEIGRGGQGTVYEAKYKGKREKEPLNVALKVIMVRGYCEDPDKMGALQNARRQMDIISRISNCPEELAPSNIVKFYRARQFDNCEESIDYKAYIIMERADFDLSRLKDKPIEMRLELCLDACLSLNSLHKLSIAHRDIKPSNYLVFKENHQLTVKLSDFGCARLYNDASSEEGMTVTGAIGSGNYRSPEVLFPTYQGEDFRCQDIWSFCLLLLELLFDFPVESRPFSMLIPIINREKRDITFSDLNRVMDQGLNLKLFDGGEILFGLILQGLRYHVKNRIANLDLLQKYLIQYRGYQKKFCRFKNSQFRFELQLLAEVDNIADVFQEIVFQDSAKGEVLFKGLYKTGSTKDKVLIRMLKVPKHAPEGCSHIRHAIANSNFIAGTPNDKLLQILEPSRQYDWNDCLFTFIVMEHGDLTLAQLYKGFDMENRLGLCYSILDNLVLLQQRRFAIRNLQLKNILLVRRGLCFIPKIVNFDEGRQNASENILREDLSAFLLLVLQMIKGEELLDRVKRLSDLSKGECDSILFNLDTTYNSKDINELANALLIALTDKNDTSRILVNILNKFAPFKQTLPTTFERTELSKLMKYEPHLTDKLMEAEKLTDRQFRVRYKTMGMEVRARLVIYDMASLKEEQRLMLAREVEMANQLKDSYEGFLCYYEGRLNPKAGYAYLITEDYQQRCSDINLLRKELMVSPNQIIIDFKNIMTGLSNLHLKHISHMDIVPSNIYFVDTDPAKLKLGGFGRCLKSSSDKPLFNNLTDQNYRPPQFFARPYDANLRFAYDVWMVGSCVVAFLCGTEALKPINDLLREFGDKGNIHPPKSYCESRRTDSSEELRASKFRKCLLLMNAAERSSNDHLETFLNSYVVTSVLNHGPRG